MAVIKLVPAFKDYLWGGNKLVRDYNKKSDLEILAESWEVSSHPDGISIVDNGTFEGKTLVEYIASKGKKVLGKKGQTFDFFPILIKFIDAKQDLSIQVHPSDEYALEHEGQYGKTEMWYILEAEPGASVYYGTKNEISKDEYKDAIENNTILDVLNKVPVTKGDVIFVEAGTIHAIGAGIVICEIQQNSNVTYRVYDFDRKDVNGNTRELHIDKAVEVSTLVPLDTSFKAQGDRVDHDSYSQTLLVSHDLFKTELISLNGSLSFDVDDQSFVALICIEGELEIKQGHDDIKLIKGESVFIDAETDDVQISGEGDLLRVSV